jgi:hypothetical protein
VTFQKNALQVQFSLANGVFAGGGNTLQIGYPSRISARIGNAGPPSQGQLDLAVYGMSLSDMNQLTQLGTQINLVGQNTVIVSAGNADDTNSMAKVFEGTVAYAWMDAQDQPNVVFRAQAYAGLYHKVAPAASTSINGSADVVTLMQKFASQMGLSFENNGVSAKVSSPYYSGSLMMQAQACAQAAGIEMDVANGTLAIWPTNGSRQGSPIDISPQTGMIGYPIVNQGGIRVKTLFNPSLKRGGTINVTSQITPASGKWNVLNLDIDLEAMVPGGNWYTEMTASRLGYSEQP